MNGQESLVLRRRLERDFGFSVHPFRYPTVSTPINDVTARLQAFVQQLGPPSTLHFIGHSLGGLVVYRFFERYPDQPPGRIVFLGTPALGSLAASRVAGMRWAAPLLGRGMSAELLAEPSRKWALSRDLGIIAGTRSVGLGQFFARFNGASDGTVAVSETRLAGATAHLTLPVSHTGMWLSARVARETGTFLETGHFLPSN